MKDNTHHPNPSTPNAIPTGVYDLNTLQTECEAIGIEPTRPNLRRIRRAIDLHQHGCVKPFYNDEIDGAFYVRSQTEQGKVYSVLPHSGCSCPDAHRLNAEFGKLGSYTAAHTRIKQSTVRCKHEMAIMLWKERMADQAKYDAWLCDQYEAEQAASDDSLVHYDPSVDFPID